MCKVRSKHALLVVLPGARNDDLPGLGITNSAFASHWMFLRDPLHSNWTRRLVTLVQMGAVAVLPSNLDDCPAWDTSSYLEFSAVMSRRLFSTDEAWTEFLSSSRTQVVASIRALHSSFTPANVEFYQWTKLYSHTKKVIFRAPAAQKDTLLAASGIHTPFIINLVCRDETSRNARDSTSSVVWLGKLGFTDSLAWIKQVDGHLGLVLSKQSFASGVLLLLWILFVAWFRPLTPSSLTPTSRSAVCFVSSFQVYLSAVLDPKSSSVLLNGKLVTLLVGLSFRLNNGPHPDSVTGWCVLMLLLQHTFICAKVDVS